MRLISWQPKAAPVEVYKIMNKFLANISLLSNIDSTLLSNPISETQNENRQIESIRELKQLLHLLLVAASFLSTFVDLYNLHTLCVSILLCLHVFFFASEKK